jgi:hypothetical protein
MILDLQNCEFKTHTHPVINMRSRVCLHIIWGKGDGFPFVLLSLGKEEEPVVPAVLSFMTY